MLHIERGDRSHTAIYRGFKHHVVFWILNDGPPPVFEVNFSCDCDKVVQDDIDILRSKPRYFQLIPPLQYTFVFEQERNRDHHFQSTA